MVSGRMIRLSQGYFARLQEHALPLDKACLAAIADAAISLDLYHWIKQRLSKERK
jgi:hypothetical protein